MSLTTPLLPSPLPLLLLAMGAGVLVAAMVAAGVLTVKVNPHLRAVKLSWLSGFAAVGSPFDS